MFSGWSNQLNNTEHDRKHQKNSIAANLFSEAFDHDKISLNFTQHSTTSTTWWKTCAKSVKTVWKLLVKMIFQNFFCYMLLLISDKCANRICILSLLFQILVQINSNMTTQYHLGVWILICLIQLTPTISWSNSNTWKRAVIFCLMGG